MDLVHQTRLICDCNLNLLRLIDGVTTKKVAWLKVKKIEKILRLTERVLESLKSRSTG